ncbi:MAG TPA: ABC transporter permease subunit [Symbiobacteriaceae bacterium]|nr:ABC transporter permease subunit [Symbiobacteriaceae bacterium]
MTLLKQHAKTEAISTLIWAVVLGLVGYLTTWLWELLSQSGSMLELQKVLENAQGVLKSLVSAGGLSLASLDGWIQGYALGTWVTLPYVIFTALFAAGMITREMDRRTMEFVLSLPVSRAQLLVSRWLVLGGSLTTLHLFHFLGVLGGLAALGERGHPDRYALALFSSLLLHLFVGTLMLLVSLFFDDYGAGLGAVMGIGLGLNILHMGTAEATGALKSVRGMLPFAWHEVQPIVMDGAVPWGHMLLLAGGALLLLAVSVCVFQRKPIAV